MPLDGDQESHTREIVTQEIQHFVALLLEEFDKAADPYIGSKVRVPVDRAITRYGLAETAELH